MGLSKSLNNYVIRPEWGTFDGRLILEVLPGGRDVQLMEVFTFIDKRGQPWPSPAGLISDGKTVMQALWTLYGSPFTGLDRIAAFPHDHQCNTRQEPWQAVHRMFYEACLCAGTDETVAAKMYFAVKTFGPRWDNEGNVLEIDYSVYDDWSDA